MSYTITDKASGESQNADTRSAAILAMRTLGVNVWAAVRLLDNADGLAYTDESGAPVSVTRARRVIDFYLDGTPVYDD